jgi:hypothetical protein
MTRSLETIKLDLKNVAKSNQRRLIVYLIVWSKRISDNRSRVLEIALSSPLRCVTRPSTKSQLERKVRDVQWKKAGAE